MKIKNILTYLLLSVFCCGLYFKGISQSRNNQVIQVLVTPNKADWTYAPGEKIKFTATIIKNHVPMKNITASYTIGLEKMKADQIGNVKIEKENVEIGKQLSLDTPGFVRCEVKVTVDGIDYRGIATAAIAPEKIKPTQKLPADFKDFWDAELKKANKIPLDVKYTLLSEKCTPN